MTSISKILCLINRYEEERVGAVWRRRRLFWSAGRWLVSQSAASIFLAFFFLFSFSTFGTRPHATDTTQLPNLFPRPLVFGEAAESYVRLGTAIQQQSTDSNKRGMRFDMYVCSSGFETAFDKRIPPLNVHHPHLSCIRFRSWIA